jgi:hypothetical protein
MRVAVKLDWKGLTLPYEGLTTLLPSAVPDRAAKQGGSPSQSGVPAAEQGTAVLNVPPVWHWQVPSASVRETGPSEC